MNYSLFAILTFSYLINLLPIKQVYEKQIIAVVTIDFVES